MLEHRYRFHGHGSLRRLYQRGSVTRHRCLTVRALPNPTRVHSRYTVIIAKKVYKHAVKRNRIRRRVYEVIRTHQTNFRQPYDVALTIFDKQMLVMPQAELENIVLGTLRSAGIINKVIPATK